MDEKITFDSLERGTSNIKIEDDGTADRKILIAIDFGTTFSGVAWAQTRRVWIPYQVVFVFLMLKTWAARRTVCDYPVA